MLTEAGMWNELEAALDRTLLDITVD